jgi:hypothetical protein
MAFSIPRLPRTALSAFVSILGFASVAFAQARVVVEVRSPGGIIADGELTLTAQEGGGTFSCATIAGTCELSGVPGGVYTASLRPTNGAPPAPRTVVIPPSGRVTLRVSTQ